VINVSPGTINIVTRGQQYKNVEDKEVNLETEITITVDLASFIGYSALYIRHYK
jgi:hypothetical protein